MAFMMPISRYSSSRVKVMVKRRMTREMRMRQALTAKRAAATTVSMT